MDIHKLDVGGVKDRLTYSFIIVKAPTKKGRHYNDSGKEEAKEIFD